MDTNPTIPNNYTHVMHYTDKDKWRRPLADGSGYETLELPNESISVEADIRSGTATNSFWAYSGSNFAYYCSIQANHANSGTKVDKFTLKDEGAITSLRDPDGIVSFNVNFPTSNGGGSGGSGGN